MKYVAALFSVLLLVVTVACAPVSQPVWPVEQSKARLTSKAFIAADGTSLPLRQWLPKGKPKAVVLALHGFNDYSNAFTDTGKFFASRGIALYAYDQRGFGKSPMTGLWADTKNLTNDAKTFLEQLTKRYPRTPLYLLGESMGGAVSMVLLAQEPLPNVKGVILVAPAVWGDGAMNPLMRASLWFVAHTTPSHKFTGEDLKILASDNIPMLRALYNDPLIIKETRADAIYGLVGLMGDAYRSAALLKIKPLVLYGEHDEVIPRAPIEEIAKDFTVPAQVIYYPKGYHMLLRDLQANKVREDIVRWMGSNKL